MATREESFARQITGQGMPPIDTLSSAGSADEKPTRSSVVLVLKASENGELLSGLRRRVGAAEAAAAAASSSK